MKNKGAVSIIAFLTLGILLILGVYFLSFTVTESQIAKSQEVGVSNYYLAEAGIYQAIWKLKNDDVWKACFAFSSDDCNCDDWSDSFFQDTSLLTENSNISVGISNIECGRGEIIATSTIVFGNKTSQRVVKIGVFKPLGEPDYDFIKDSPLFGSGNMALTSSNLNIYDGNVLSGAFNPHLTQPLPGNINFKNSQVNIYDNPSTIERQEGQILAKGSLDICNKSSLNSSSTCTDNLCTELCEGYVLGISSCPQEDILMPMIDFDEGPDSYKNKAQQAQDNNYCSVLCNGIECGTKCIYTKQEFNNLLSQIGAGGTLTFDQKNNSVYYIQGSIEVEGGKNIVINGALVVDGTFTMGTSGKDPANLTINKPEAGIPSGLIVKNNIELGELFSASNIEGLIYALGNFKLKDSASEINILGGKIIGGNFDLINAKLNIYLDNKIISEAVWGGPEPPSSFYSPIIAIEHWEEKY